MSPRHDHGAVGRRRYQTAVAGLLDAATEPYRAAGRFAWHFARGKLGRDPAFRGLLERGLVRDGALTDIGCGQGLLAAWLIAARERYDAHDLGRNARVAATPGAASSWPAHWPPPPRLAAITGIELMAADVARADRALRARAPYAHFVAGDMRTTPFPVADTTVILDVLHYVPFADQDAVLARVRDALRPGGVLLLRVGDAAAGFGFRWSNWVDRTVMIVRGHGRNPIWCRPLDAWLAALARIGFAVDAVPMSEGTLFANVLLVARKR